MAKTFSMILGVVMLALGLWGLGGGGFAHLTGPFGVNALHNLIHLATGALALVAALNGERYSMLFCLAFGSLYGLLSIAGFFLIPWLMSALNLNMADNFLHLAVAAGCLWVGGQSKGA